MKSWLLVSILLMSPALANAERFDFAAKVEFLITHNPLVFGRADADWVSLEGVMAAGACLTAPNPNGETRVVIRIPDNMERAHATALAAQMSGRRIQVSIDDTIRDAGGACILRWLTARQI